MSHLHIKIVYDLLYRGCVHARGYSSYLINNRVISKGGPHTFMLENMYGKIYSNPSKYAAFVFMLMLLNDTILIYA